MSGTSTDRVYADDLLRVADFLISATDPGLEDEGLEDTLLKVSSWLRAEVARRYERGRQVELSKPSARDRLTDRQRRVLAHLEDRYPSFRTVDETAAATGIYRGDVYNALVALERRGFAGRLRSDADRAHAWYSLEAGGS